MAGTGDTYPALLVLTGVIAFSIPLVFYAFARPFGGPRLAVLAAGAGLLAGCDILVVVVDAVRAGWALDVWPTGFEVLRAVVPSTQLDYWVHHNERPFNPFYVATAWAPQHVAAVLLALSVLSLVGPRGFDQAIGGKRGRSALLLPAISAYVALALACGVAGWLLVHRIQASPRLLECPRDSPVGAGRTLRRGTVDADAGDIVRRRRLGDRDDPRRVVLRELEQRRGVEWNLW